MKNPTVKHLMLFLLALAFLALPVAAKADVFTFNAPATTPNYNSNTNNPSQSNYQGGANQFNLDHHLAYTWRVSGVNIPQGHEITSATLTITSIRNWDSNPNTLFIHLLNTAQTYASNSAGSPTLGWHTQTFNLPGGAVTAYVDVNLNQAPVTSISDAFGADYASNPLVVGANNVGNNLFLDAESFSTTVTNYTLNLTNGQLAQLAAYIANGSDFAFGFDADCHFWNNGIRFTFTTAPTATPEPATMLLLGSGLAGFSYFQRRRRDRVRR
jgi:hypothetical protein